MKIGTPGQNNTALERPFPAGRRPAARKVRPKRAIFGQNGRPVPHCIMQRPGMAPAGRHHCMAAATRFAALENRVLPGDAYANGCRLRGDRHPAGITNRLRSARGGPRRRITRTPRLVRLDFAESPTMGNPPHGHGRPNRIDQAGSSEMMRVPERDGWWSLRAWEPGAKFGDYPARMRGWPMPSARGGSMWDAGRDAHAACTRTRKGSSEERCSPSTTAAVTWTSTPGDWSIA